MTDDVKNEVAELMEQYAAGANIIGWAHRVMMFLVRIREAPTTTPTVDPEDAGWLRTLIDAYRNLSDQLNKCGFADEDPSATVEMLSAVERLADAIDPPRPPEPPAIGMPPTPDGGSIEDNNVPF